MTVEAALQVHKWLDEYRAAGASVAHLVCDRHDPDAVAFTLVEPDLTSDAMTWGQLTDESRRMATVLAEAGVVRGDRVPVLLGKRRALVVTLMGLWRLGAVHVPLFTAFATGAIELRTEGSGAKLVVTDASQRNKVDPISAVTVIDVDDLTERARTAEPLAESVAIGGDGPLAQLYTSGTTGKVDDDGYFSFTSRDDDVILAAGYRIGPFDVESVMVAHPAVGEVAVVGRPDPEGIRGEVVEAFVVLAGGYEASDALASEMQSLVRDKYSKHAYPRSVHFVEALPKTPSGKIQRFVLRREGP